MMNFFQKIILSGILLALPAGPAWAESIPSSPPPLPEKIGQWVRQGNPEKYEGEDLFLYINGGADIYHEYGFKEVLSSEYEKEGNGRISVELYRMEDPLSAFGIFSLKTGGKWDRTSGGNLSHSEDYYLNLLAGDFLITITSIDINEETEKGIRIIREFLEKQISSPVVIPETIRKIQPGKYPLRVYFEGDLGLMNNYSLFSASAGILSGAAGSGKGGQVLLLEYPPQKAPGEITASLSKLLKKEGRYSDFTPVPGGVHFADKKQNRLYMTSIDKYIVIFIERDPEKCIDAAESLKKHILSLDKRPPATGKN